MPYVLLNAHACRALSGWLQQRPKVGKNALFLSAQGQLLGVRGIQFVVGRWLQAAGITHASVAKLRHTPATHLLAHGARLKEVQTLLGHVDSRDTAIYIPPAKRIANRHNQRVRAID